jgi:hypothetical protein
VSGDREAARDHIRSNAASYFHFVGSCRMGDDDLAVVDDDARGGDWNSADDRNGRVTVQDGDGWTRRRWERSLG